ncbi:aliphatic sulfonate ABC transporter substrate-binding protein [Stutzerimonas kirkiae]|uniref:Putative aliphatic sulfonates-binding protein n=1 Tax=Stutzerimonas kirkiae TaxID=2211392 RepID=A0A4Q9RC30_9GAMM|nr:aliphatic sulfonate ABC transporter substrate-binding protein [Stutzerimonas kirkiae]TBU98553.1 aliphatic sulfonate ABC transporter substrate-binding protein [Stutzerimonas kirkiae]TBV04273.1 aliphatic sulfonate ABC transporter substrate-binding protein [Stutzerimonas kirkiae]TBV10976.1 aliphatic sulfonate ABC transporter substrate-binding protein [Stutzerimonas kirkiae]TBV14336.1 aliphatic sulfonate ABC transporter substrate-binding protein [Stutzerimonas kirkiae]
MLARLLLIVAVLCASLAQAADPQALRIGYQKGSTTLVLAKQHGLLERRFADTRVQWIEFPAGPQMLEALNIGSLDIGSTGDIPPIFAQAAGADLLYIGAEPPKPQAEVILVAEASPLRSVAELKGKRVALQKGSSAHNLLLRALAREGLAFSDIHPIYLAPAEARAAFERGSVDAWAIWDPFYAALELEGGVRLLADGRGLDLSGPFYLAARSFAEAHPAFIPALIDELNRAEALTRSDEAGSLRLLAAFIGLPEAVLARTFERRPSSPIGPLSEAIIAAQQHTADLFLQNRLLPRAVDVRAALWQAPPQR